MTIKLVIFEVLVKQYPGQVEKLSILKHFWNCVALNKERKS